MSEIKNTPNRLQVQYKETVVPELMKKYGYKSVMEAPKLVKVVINIGVGDATSPIFNEVNPSVIVSPSSVAAS